MQPRLARFTHKPLKFLQLPKHSPDVYFVCAGRRTGTTLFSAIFSSDPRANSVGQEAQFLTRLIEAPQWGHDNFTRFGQSLFRDLGNFRRLYQRTIADFVTDIAKHIWPDGVLVLKNSELSLVISHVITLMHNIRLFVILRDPRDQVTSKLRDCARWPSDCERNPAILKCSELMNEFQHNKAT